MILPCSAIKTLPIFLNSPERIASSIFDNDGLGGAARVEELLLWAAVQTLQTASIRPTNHRTLLVGKSWHLRLDQTDGNGKGKPRKSLTAPAPVSPSANIQTRPCRRYSSDSPDQNRGCRSTWSGDRPARSRNWEERSTPDTIAHRCKQGERNFHPRPRRSHTTGRHQCGCGLHPLRLRA